jgi:hypothetical protein
MPVPAPRRRTKRKKRTERGGGRTALIPPRRAALSAYLNGPFYPSDIDGLGQKTYARLLRARERGPIEHRWLRGVSVRFAGNHRFGVEPPIADETYGYAAGTANSRGRQFVLDLTQRF